MTVNYSKAGHVVSQSKPFIHKMHIAHVFKMWHAVAVVTAIVLTLNTLGCLL